MNAHQQYDLLVETMAALNERAHRIIEEAKAAVRVSRRRAARVRRRTRRWPGVAH